MGVRVPHQVFQEASVRFEHVAVCAPRRSSRRIFCGRRSRFFCQEAGEGCVVEVVDRGRRHGVQIIESNDLLVSEDFYLALTTVNTEHMSEAAALQ